MRYVVIILLFLLSSCSAQYHLNRALQKDPGIIDVQSDTLTSINVSYKDTVIHLSRSERLQLVSDTIVNDTTIIDTVEKFGPVKAYTKDSVARAKTSIIGDQLFLSVSYAIDTIIKLNDTIQAKTKQVNRLQQIKQQKEATITKKESLIKKIQRWGIVILICIILVAVLLRFIG